MNIKTEIAMNKRIWMLLLAGLFAAVSLAACSDDEQIDPSSAEPTVTYPYDRLVADLNMADNLPVVAVVKSGAGLKSVSLTIRTDGGDEVPVVTVTEFFNPRSYSLSERVNYKADYTEAVVEATDLLGRTVETVLPIEIIDVVEPPLIVFTPASWEYDETVGGQMANTQFSVTSAVALKSIEMFRVTSEGQTQYGGTVTGGDTDPWTTYTFDELIRYGETDRSFKVKATDSYDQVRIVSLPVKYKTVPPPTVVPASETLWADKDEVKAVGLEIESLAGVVKVELFPQRGKTFDQEPAVTKNYDKVKELSFAEQITFTDDISGVKAVVTDNVGRSTTVTVKAVVGMELAEQVVMGAKGYSDGNASRPGIYSFFSLRYMKGLALSEIIAAASDASVDADWLFYDMNGNVRIYFPGGNKANEYAWSGGTSKDLPQVQTRYQLRKDLDFDNATAAEIAEKVIASQVSTAELTGLQAGDVIAFKTGGKSSAGGNRVGLIKIESYVRNTNTSLSTITISVKFPKK